MKGWHFLNEDRRLRFGDGRLVEVGKELRVPESPDYNKLWVCLYGMHGSFDILDALKYATGLIVCWCEFEETGAVYEDDKFCSRARTALWMFDAQDTIFSLSRFCALEVADTWDCPYQVKEYLHTGLGASLAFEELIEYELPAVYSDGPSTAAYRITHCAIRGETTGYVSESVFAIAQFRDHFPEKRDKIRDRLLAELRAAGAPLEEH